MTTRMRGLGGVITAALMVAAAGVPLRADAQDRIAVTLGAGSIFGTDSYPAEPFGEAFLIGSVQRTMRRHFVLDGDLSHWSHASRFDYGPHDVSGPDGVIGRVGHTTVIDDRESWTLGLNFLVRSTGAVRVFGGAGAGLVTQNTKYLQTDADCTSVTPPLVCGTYVTARTRGPLPNMRMLGGVEVPLGRRLTLVGTVRSDASGVEDRSHTMTAIGAVRLSLR